MLNTNAEEFRNDLSESVTAFLPLEEVDVTVREIFSGDKTQAEVVVGGKTYLSPEAEIFGSATEVKRLRKRALKLAVYEAMKDYTGKSHPWGSLTGIRPTKLALNISAGGGDYEKEFIERLGVSEKKTRLVKDVLEAQRGIRSSAVGKTDLFVGIPFCRTRCSYCSFISAEIGDGKLAREYAETLAREIEAAKEIVKTPRSVYVGGGTPVSLDMESLKRILAAIGEPHCEWTVEAGRPDSIDEEKLELMRRAGVTRICVNPQTFCDKTLKLLSRQHTAADVVEKYKLAKSFGFDVNMDFIAGLPEETTEIFKRSIDEAIELSPDDITVHTLSLKRGSKMKESLTRLGDGYAEEMVDYAYTALTAAGYRPYYLYRQKYTAANLENTGYAKAGKECLYNVDVMEELTSVAACGAGAVSKRVFDSENRIERYGAPKDISTYLGKIDKIIVDKAALFS